MNLIGSVVAITGASRGLGAALAKRLAAKSCRLALIDLTEASLQAIKSTCIDAGAQQVEVYAANVANEENVVDVMQRIGNDFGSLQALINNAGITRDSLTLKYKDNALISEMTLEQWQDVIDVNLTGSFLCGREAAKQMVAMNSVGCIINISSISRNGNMGQANYSASKAGVHALAVVWAKELSRYGIRAASVAPGFIATEMVKQMKPEARNKISASIPVNRLGEPDEIASSVEFILENDYVNGCCIDVDGALRL